MTEEGKGAHDRNQYSRASWTVSYITLRRCSQLLTGHPRRRWRRGEEAWWMMCKMRDGGTVRNTTSAVRRV